MPRAAAEWSSSRDWRSISFCSSRRFSSRSDRHVGRQAQLRQVEVRRVGVLGEEERIVHLAEEARLLPRRDRAVADDVRVATDVGMSPAPAPARHHRAVGREQVERVLQPDVVGRRRVPGQRVVRRRVVVLHGVGHAPHERDLVHDLRHPRQALGDLDRRRNGRDRLVRPADLVGRVRLHVEHVDVARPAELVEEDHGLRPDRRHAADRFSSAANNRGKFNPNNSIPPICKALRRVSLTLLKLLQAKDVM